MMATPLHLVLYGTLIPDLRTLCYDDPDGTAPLWSTTDGPFLVDRYLRGNEVALSREALNGIIEYLYRKSPADEALATLVHEYPGSISAEMPPTGLFESYRAFLPDGSLSTHSGHRIVVSRQIDRAADVIRGGGDAILYETAARLRRELELRGELVPDGPAIVHGAHGG